MRNTENRDGYWKANLSLMGTLLTIWFVVAYVLGILLKPSLEGIMLGEAPLGYWIAHNGSIYVFIALIAVYASQAGKLDKQFGVEE